MAKDAHIAKYNQSWEMQIIRMLHLERYRRLVIETGVEECLDKLKQLDGTRINYHVFSVVLETDPNRFMLFRKSLNHDHGKIIGTISEQSDNCRTEISLEIYPSTDIISVTLLALFLGSILIVLVFPLLFLGLAPAWCYVSWGLFALFPTIGWITSMIMARNHTLQEFETLYLKTLSVNYQFVDY